MSESFSGPEAKIMTTMITLCFTDEIRFFCYDAMFAHHQALFVWALKKILSNSLNQGDIQGNKQERT